MNTNSFGDLRDFHQFVGEKVKVAGASLSPEDVLDEWRALHPEPESKSDLRLTEDDIAAIQEALDDIENGDQGISLEEFEQELQLRHNLPPIS